MGRAGLARQVSPKLTQERRSLVRARVGDAPHTDASNTSGAAAPPNSAARFMLSLSCRYRRWMLRSLLKERPIIEQRRALATIF
jgi:hypothetical protein